MGGIVTNINKHKYKSVILAILGITSTGLVIFGDSAKEKINTHLIVGAVSAHNSKVYLVGSNNVPRQVDEALSTSLHSSKLSGYDYRSYGFGLVEEMKLDYFEDLQIETKQNLFKEFETIGGNILEEPDNEFKKVESIANYVKFNYHYDKKDSENNLTADRAFKLKEGSCQQFSILVQALLNNYKIPNVILVGSVNNQPHMWNMVIINNKQYYLDSSLNSDNLTEIESSKVNYKIINHKELEQFRKSNNL